MNLIFNCIKSTITAYAIFTWGNLGFIFGFLPLGLNINTLDFFMLIFSFHFSQYFINLFTQFWSPCADSEKITKVHNLT